MIPLFKCINGSFLPLSLASISLSFQRIQAMKYLHYFLHFTLQASAYPLLGSLFGIPLSASYDYVIVSGGTAGLTVAARLVKDSSLSVAVV
jgi:hypothetical protein